MSFLIFGNTWAGGLQLPLISAIPFALVLFLIATVPLFFKNFWELEKNKILLMAFITVPTVLQLLFISESTKGGSILALKHGLIDYFCFMSLIGSLYIVASGITIRFNFQFSPLSNVIFLGIGAMLTNILGTTGASVLLFKPFSHANINRSHKVHLVLFFIFIIGNMGGLLTPLGDPPLFLGFLNGIDFFWTTSLWPQWFVSNIYLLLCFFLIDFYYSKKSPTVLLEKEKSQINQVCISGKYSFAFLFVLIILVLLQSPTIGKLVGGVFAKIIGVDDLTLDSFYAAFAQIFVAIVAFIVTPLKIRNENDFSIAPIVEVAILFIAIFLTMIPALEFLRQQSLAFPLHHPWQYFWITGGMSSVLDNAPTFMAFASLAAGSEGISILPLTKPVILSAICCGAVFMGANTYIGNGPNFLIKALAEKDGIAMPSFFMYTFYALLVLLPLYLFLTFCFFV